MSCYRLPQTNSLSAQIANVLGSNYCYSIGQGSNDEKDLGCVPPDITIYPSGVSTTATGGTVRRQPMRISVNPSRLNL